MGGPCPGSEWCAGNELEFSGLRVATDDAASITFEAEVTNHAFSSLGNPNECTPPDPNITSGIGGILTLVIRNIPESKVVEERCFPHVLLPPTKSTAEVPTLKPEPDDTPTLYTAEAILCTSDTADCSAVRTVSFTLNPDGTVDTNGDTDGGNGDGDGDGDDRTPLERLQDFIEKLGLVSLVVLAALIVIAIRDILD